MPWRSSSVASSCWHLQRCEIPRMTLLCLVPFSTLFSNPQFLHLYLSLPRCSSRIKLASSGPSSGADILPARLVSSLLLPEDSSPRLLEKAPPGELGAILVRRYTYHNLVAVEETRGLLVYTQHGDCVSCGGPLIISVELMHFQQEVSQHEQMLKASPRTKRVMNLTKDLVQHIEIIQALQPGLSAAQAGYM